MTAPAVDPVGSAPRTSVSAVRGVLPGLGDRAALVHGALGALPAGCWWVPGPREVEACTLRGMGEVSAGGSRSFKVAPASSAPALRALHGVGLALASGRPALVQLGPGAVADGALYEALNVATQAAASVIFLVAWPSLAGAPVPMQGPPPSALAAPFGASAAVVDGRDGAAVGLAVGQALASGGVWIIEAGLD